MPKDWKAQLADAEKAVADRKEQAKQRRAEMVQVLDSEAERKRKAYPYQSMLNAEFSAGLQEAVRGNPLAEKGLREGGEDRLVVDPTSAEAFVSEQEGLYGRYKPDVDEVDVYAPTPVTYAHELAHRGHELLKREGLDILEPRSTTYSEGLQGEMLMRYMDLINYPDDEKDKRGRSSAERYISKTHKRQNRWVTHPTEALERRGRGLRKGLEAKIFAHEAKKRKKKK